MHLADRSNAELDALIEPYQKQLMIACDWNTRATIFGLIMISALSRIAGPERAKHIGARLLQADPAAVTFAGGRHFGNGWPGTGAHRGFVPGGLAAFS